MGSSKELSQAGALSAGEDKGTRSGGVRRWRIAALLLCLSFWLAVGYGCYLARG